METILELYQAVRERFPEITTKADKEHINYWGNIDPEFAYSWFESLSKALNSEMLKGVSFKSHESLFSLITQSLAGCGKEVHTSIDVAFVENLFWQVPGPKAEPYWQELPGPLKELYVGFHHRTPL